MKFTKECSVNSSVSHPFFSPNNIILHSALLFFQVFRKKVSRVRLKLPPLSRVPTCVYCATLTLHFPAGSAIAGFIYAQLENICCLRSNRFHIFDPSFIKTSRYNRLSKVDTRTLSNDQKTVCNFCCCAKQILHILSVK